MLPNAGQGKSDYPQMMAGDHIANIVKFVGLMLIMCFVVGIGCDSIAFYHGAAIFARAHFACCLNHCRAGYPGIRSVLLDGGVFSNQCAADNMSCSVSYRNPCLPTFRVSYGSGTEVSHGGLPMQAQADMLGRVVNVAFILVNLTGLLNGLLVDWLRPRAAAMLGAVLWTICAAITAVAPGRDSHWHPLVFCSMVTDCCALLRPCSQWRRFYYCLYRLQCVWRDHVLVHPRPLRG